MQMAWIRRGCTFEEDRDLVAVGSSKGVKLEWLGRDGGHGSGKKGDGCFGNKRDEHM